MTDQLLRGPGGDIGAAHIGRVLFDVVCPVSQGLLCLNESFDHTNVVQHGDVIDRSDKQRPDHAVAVPDVFTIKRARWVPDGGDRLLRICPPLAKAGAVQIDDIQHVEQQAARIVRLLAGHVGAGNPTVVHGRWLNRMHRGRAIQQVRAGGNITGRIDAGNIGLHAVVNHDAVVNVDTGAVEKAQVGLNTRSQNDNICA